MGIWGTGIYANDISSDVKDDCANVFSVKNPEEGTRVLVDYYLTKDMVEEDDPEYADFWFSLADWQWNKGILIKEVKDKALKLIDSGIGLSLWLEEGKERDIEKRKTVLKNLKDKLLSTPPPPKKIKNSYIRYPFKPGDILAVKPNEKCTGSIKKDGIWEDVPYFSANYLEKHLKKIYGKKKACSISFVEGYKPIINRDSYFLLLCVRKESVPMPGLVEGLFSEDIDFLFYDFYSPNISNVKEKLPALSFMKIANPETGKLEFATTTDYAKYGLERYKKICYAPEELKKVHAIEKNIRFGAEIHFKTFLETYEMINNPQIHFDEASKH